MGKQEAYDKMDAAFQDGSFESADNDTLQRYLISLSNQNIPNSSVQHRDIIRGLTINHILLQNHITDLDAKNSKLQWWVIFLAVVALVSAIIQTIATLLPYFGIFPPESPHQVTPQAVQHKIAPQAETLKTNPVISAKEKK